MTENHTQILLKEGGHEQEKVGGGWGLYSEKEKDR